VCGLWLDHTIQVFIHYIIGQNSTENNHLELIGKVKGTEITGITVVQLLHVALALQVPES
jgi:hypothetical protein